MGNVAVHTCTPGHGYSRAVTLKKGGQAIYFPSPGPFAREQDIQTNTSLSPSVFGNRDQTTLIMHTSPKSLTPRNQYLRNNLALNLASQSQEASSRSPLSAQRTHGRTVDSVVGPSRPATGREPMISPDAGLPRPAWPARADGGGGSDPLYRFLFADLSIDTVKAG